MSAQVRDEVRSLRKPWLAPLRYILVPVMLASLIAGPGVFIYVMKQPSEIVSRVSILSDEQIAGHRSKFETYPIAWLGVAAIFAGVGAAATREWSRRKEQQIDGLLERRYGVFPPPAGGFLERFRGGGPPPDARPEP